MTRKDLSGKVDANSAKAKRRRFIYIFCFIIAIVAVGAFLRTIYTTSEVRLNATGSEASITAKSKPEDLDIIAEKVTSINIPAYEVDLETKEGAVLTYEEMDHKSTSEVRDVKWVSITPSIDGLDKDPSLALKVSSLSEPRLKLRLVVHHSEETPRFSIKWAAARNPLASGQFILAGTGLTVTGNLAIEGKAKEVLEYGLEPSSGWFIVRYKKNNERTEMGLTRISKVRLSFPGGEDHRLDLRGPALPASWRFVFDLDGSEKKSLVVSTPTSIVASDFLFRDVSEGTFAISDSSPSPLSPPSQVKLADGELAVRSPITVSAQGVSLSLDGQVREARVNDENQAKTVYSWLAGIAALISCATGTVYWFINLWKTN